MSSDRDIRIRRRVPATKTRPVIISVSDAGSGAVVVAEVASQTATLFAKTW